MFIFRIMERLGIPNPFINMIRLLLQDASISININNQVTILFDLHRGVSHGFILESPGVFVLHIHSIKKLLWKMVRNIRIRMVDIACQMSPDNKPGHSKFTKKKFRSQKLLMLYIHIRQHRCIL